MEKWLNDPKTSILLKKVVLKRNTLNWMIEPNEPKGELSGWGLALKYSLTSVGNENWLWF